MAAVFRDGGLFFVPRGRIGVEALPSITPVASITIATASMPMY